MKLNNLFTAINLPPIQAYCDFENGQTVVGFEGLIDNHVTINTQCIGQACFQHFFNYAAPISQIAELVKLSGECSQQISFNCKSTPLSVSISKLNPIRPGGAFSLNPQD